MAELMKGEVWAERKNAKDRKGNPIVAYPVYVEDKHDEIRCHVKVFDKDVQFLSYSGKALANMQRFKTQFLILSDISGHTEFDLGFEVNGNFNDSYRWVRSTRGVPQDLENAACKFYLFGLPELGGTLRAQYDARIAVAKFGWRGCEFPVEVPHCVIAYCEQDVDDAFTLARARGLEGVIVKQPYMLYQRKRTDGWLKMKPESDADGQIIGFVEAVCGKDQPEKGLKVGDPLGRIGSVLVHCEDGSEAAPHGIPHDLGRDMYLHPDKYLKQWCEFKFMERDRQNGYRHPTFHRIREEK